MTKITWLSTEIKLIIDNFDKTTDELFKLLDGRRSKKSIARKIENLREEGKIGERSKQTIKRAYRQRKRRTRAEILADKEHNRSSNNRTVSADYQPVDDDGGYQFVEED